MILIAESGSTKTDIAILDNSGDERCRFSTMGFNPYFHSSEKITQELNQQEVVKDYAEDITDVFFYGAGCSSEHLCAVVRKGLEPIFRNAAIKVDHDLTSCAYATYSGEPGVSCILGTGSNSVFFDGTAIRPSNSGLGFILGDEGSASHIGKKLVTSYFYRTMPEPYRLLFAEDYNMNKDHVVKRVYQEERANVYLANMAPFANRHIDQQFFWQLVFDGFREFVDYHVLCFEEAPKVPIHFVGSIAHYFQDVLEDTLSHFDLRMGQVIQKPLDGLIAYHQKYLQRIPNK